MSSHVAWNDIRTEQIARAGGEEAIAAGKREMLAEVLGHRLAEVRRARGLTQQQVADRMGVTKGRVSQIERGKISGRPRPLRQRARRPTPPSDLLRRRRHHRHRLTLS